MKWLISNCPKPKAGIVLTAGENKRLRDPADGASASKSQNSFQNTCTRPGPSGQKDKIFECISE